MTMTQLVERLRSHILAHGVCHHEHCGDNPKLGKVERRSFIEAPRRPPVNEKKP
jgi:hypothetical protein